MSTVHLDGKVESTDGVLEPEPHLIIRLRTQDGDEGLHTVKVFGKIASYWQAMLKPGQALSVTGAGFRDHVRAATLTT